MASDAHGLRWVRDVARRPIGSLLVWTVLLLASPGLSWSADDAACPPPDIRPQPGRQQALTTSTAQPGTEPAVVFVPGILGSKIIRNSDGVVIWGKNKADAKALVFDPNVPVSVELLDVFEFPNVIPNQNVYGKALCRLKQLVKDENLFVFPYDWRRDIRDTAKDFDRMMRQWNLADRDVVILAHSMGGLVVWWWQQEFYSKSRYPFEVQHLILLGTPLQGSCEMARMLLLGYQDIPEKFYNSSGERSYLSHVAYRQVFIHFFETLRPAALTYPSIFQLLPLPPSDNERLACIRDQALPDDPIVDYFSPATWSNSPRHRLFLDKILKEDPWKETGLGDREAFMQRVSRAVDAGRDFRKALVLKTAIPLTMFGSNSYYTVEQVVIGSKQGVLGNTLCERNESETLFAAEYVVCWEAPESNGDGRVTFSSSRPKTITGFLRKTYYEHGALVEDEEFLKFLSRGLPNFFDELKKTRSIAQPQRPR